MCMPTQAGLATGPAPTLRVWYCHVRRRCGHAQCAVSLYDRTTIGRCVVACGPVAFTDAPLVINHARKCGTPLTGRTQVVLLPGNHTEAMVADGAPLSGAMPLDPTHQGGWLF